MDLRHQSSVMCVIMLGREGTHLVCSERRKPHTSHYLIKFIDTLIKQFEIKCMLHVDEDVCRAKPTSVENVQPVWPTTLMQYSAQSA